jgi:hypothetical protein
MLLVQNECYYLHDEVSRIGGTRILYNLWVSGHFISLIGNSLNKSGLK